MQWQRLSGSPIVTPHQSSPAKNNPSLWYWWQTVQIIRCIVSRQYVTINLFFRPIPNILWDGEELNLSKIAGCKIYRYQTNCKWRCSWYALGSEIRQQQALLLIKVTPFQVCRMIDSTFISGIKVGRVTLLGTCFNQMKTLLLYYMPHQKSTYLLWF